VCLVQQGLRGPRVRGVEEDSPDAFEVRDRFCVLWRGCDVGARVGVDEKQESRLRRLFDDARSTERCFTRDCSGGFA
jgi:hypothetical protein